MSIVSNRSGNETRVIFATLLFASAASGSRALWQPLIQSLAQLRQRLAHSFLDGLYRDIERDGDFRVFESLVATQLKDRPASLRQTIDRRSNCPFELGAEHLILG